MKVALAPYLPIILKGDMDNMAFRNLCLFDLPRFVIVIVPCKWDVLLSNSKILTESYETYRLLMELHVEEIEQENKAKYIHLSPDILPEFPEDERDAVRQQLFALSLMYDSRRIFAGSESDIEWFEVSTDHKSIGIVNYNPYTSKSIIELIESYTPKLEQLKHSHEGRSVGNKDISPFSAYNKYDDSYAKQLLMAAFLDHPADVDDRTYLYTYDKKNKTFVEFRPGRNNVYHGMDIGLERARKMAPDIVRKYHK